jgi:hypothetical protein
LQLWERVEDLCVPVYLHPRDPNDMAHDYQDHPELLGATLPATRTRRSGFRRR